MHASDFKADGTGTAATVQVAADGTTACGTTVANTAQVTLSGLPAGYRAITPAGASSTASPVTIGGGICDAVIVPQGEISAAARAVLSVRKSGPAIARRGSGVTYRIRVTNSSGVTATDVVITDTPPGAMRIAGTAPGAQASQMVVVPDVQARLGNIYINGDKAVGTGRVEVPGDASITVTNNTAASVVVNNMTIEAYLSGRLRFNGGLVNSNADINYYSGGGATFSSVITGLTQGLPVPLVKIVSNYDATNPLYYNANDPLFARHTAFVAPDITTSSGTVIDNQRGLVDISSQAGSVYAGGTISAGTGLPRTTSSTLVPFAD